MADLNFRIASYLDNAGFQAAAKAMRENKAEASGLGQAFDNLNEAAEGLKLAMQGFVGLQIIEFFRDVVNETVSAEQQQIQLKARVDATGLSFDANSPKIQAYLENIQELTHISKEELIPAFELLIDRTRNVRTAQELLTTTVGFARAQHKDYATAAAEVVGVLNKTPRALLMAARELGVHGTAAKDNVKVMAALVAQSQTLIDKTSALGGVVGDMKNTWLDFKIELGEGVTPALVLVGDVGIRALNLVLGGVRALWNALLAGSQTIALVILEPLALVSKTAATLRDVMRQNIVSEGENMLKANQVMVDALTKFGQKSGEAADNYVDKNKKAFDALTDEQQQAISNGLAAAAAGDQAKYTLSMAALDKIAKAQKKALRDGMADQLLTEKDKAALFESVDNMLLQRRADLQKQFDKARFDQQSALQTSQIALLRAGSEEELKAKIKLLDDTTAAQRQQAADSLLTDDQRRMQLLVISNKDTVERQKLYMGYYKAVIDGSAQAGKIIGDDLGQALAGQVVNWHKALADILKMVINAAETTVMARYMAGAAAEVAQKGWLGVASGALLIAAGGAAASAVAGLVADPSSSSSMPSTSAASPPSSPSNFGASGPSSVAAAPAQSSAITVNIYGDTINDNGYIDRLAHRLSQAVNNRDVRLIATQANGLT